MKEILEDICIFILGPILIIVISAILIFGMYFGLTKLNIAMGPYECVDIDGNTLICTETWRSNGTLYGITEDGKTVDLKSYKSTKEE